MADLEEMRDGRVAILTMNRPDRLNALSRDMLEGLLEALPRLAHDDEVGCVVLTGAGRGFCAGGDIGGMASDSSDRTLEQGTAWLRRSMETSRWLREMPKPTIAMVNGPIAGAGMSLGLACDIRIAAEEARFVTAFANVGFSGDFGGSYFLTQIVGTAKARELYFTADKLSAQEALDLGIYNRVVAADALRDETLALARRLADGPGIALGYMKKNLNAALTLPLAQALDMEAMHHMRCGETQDHKEAAKAFMEKRTPVFNRR
ncbi:enoyl-CoA hydratase [Marinibaculum pumilum]|uniref:Enoyl-CoA hydratase n=1 Tax=Marinibaculum pumilum TaxID=1766165 RepID=A0ABV7KX29_9PROT